MARNNSETIQSLEMFYEPVCNRDIGASFAYRAQLRLNSPELGVLLPSVYLPVAERTVQASKLSAYTIREAADTVVRFIEKDIYYNWVSAYVPLRYLQSDGFFETVTALTEEKEIKPARLCFELPGELLYTDPADFKIIRRLKDAGFGILLSDFGDDYCPVMQLGAFSPDYVLLNPSLTKRLCSKDEKTVTAAYSLIEMIQELKIQPIATVVNTKKIDDALPDNLSLYCGRLAGKTRKLQNIRA